MKNVEYGYSSKKAYTGAKVVSQNVTTLTSPVNPILTTLVSWWKAVQNRWALKYPDHEYLLMRTDRRSYRIQTPVYIQNQTSVSLSPEALSAKIE